MEQPLGIVGAGRTVSGDSNSDAHAEVDEATVEREGCLEARNETCSKPLGIGEDDRRGQHDGELGPRHACHKARIRARRVGSGNDCGKARRGGAQQLIRRRPSVGGVDLVETSRRDEHRGDGCCGGAAEQQIDPDARVIGGREAGQRIATRLVAARQCGMTRRSRRKTVGRAHREADQLREVVAVQASGDNVRRAGLIRRRDTARIAARQQHEHRPAACLDDGANFVRREQRRCQRAARIDDDDPVGPR